GAARQGRQGNAAAAYGLGHDRRPRRDGREGDHQHPHLPRCAQAAGSRAAEHALSESVPPWPKGSTVSPLLTCSERFLMTGLSRLTASRTTERWKVAINGLPTDGKGVSKSSRATARSRPPRSICNQVRWALRSVMTGPSPLSGLAGSRA